MASYLPAIPHKEMPQQKTVARGIDPERLIEKAAAFLEADLERMKKSRKVPADLVLDSDLMLYLLWQQGHLTNQQIGELFGLTHSTVSRRISIFKNLLPLDKTARELFEQLKSKVEMRHPC